MGKSSTFRITLTAVLAALVCAATAIFHIPSPIGGYLHLGDGLVLLSAFLLGPIWGALAAGLGSMLADLLAGYPMYAVGTLVVKALAALVAGAVYGRLKKGRAAMLISGLCGETVVVVGYLVFAAVVLGYGAGALAEVPGNLCQGAAGIALSLALTPALVRNPWVREKLNGVSPTIE